MVFHKKTLIFFFLLLACASRAYSALSFEEVLEQRVREFRLDNGLVVLILERRDVPIVSCRIVYKVGAVYEHEGISGAAHLLEHLAFNGTRKIGTNDYSKEKKVLKKLHALYSRLEQETDEKHRAVLKKEFDSMADEAMKFVVPDEIGAIYKRNGAVGLNAFTGKDTTTYTVALPSNRLDLWAEIESDRMANSVMRKFYREREIVLEERELRVENNPSGYAYERLFLTAFEVHPYRLPTIGYKHDIANLTAEKVQNFFQKYYVPNNAVISIVGDVDADETIELIRKKFGKIPAGKKPAPVKAVEPVQLGEKRLKIKFETEPFILIAFRKPAILHKDDYLFDLIEMILNDGRTSRLHKNIIQDKQTAVSISTRSGMPGAIYPNLFVIHAIPRGPHTNKELERDIYEELERLKNEPVSKAELARVINNIDASFVRSLASNGGLAGLLAHFQSVAGDWRYILKARKIWRAITPQEIMEAAKTYLVDDNKTVVMVEKIEKTKMQGIVDDID